VEPDDKGRVPYAMPYHVYVLLLAVHMVVGHGATAFLNGGVQSILPLPCIRVNGHVTAGCAARLSSRCSGQRTLVVGRGSVSDLSNDTRSAGTSHSKLPREMMPLTLGVFAQTLGEGIALSSLPLYLTNLGASPLLVGLGISCFSVAQMTRK